MTNQQLILLVEDSPSQALEYSEYLKRAGYQVIIVEDGLEVLGVALQYQPQLVVLDINLPGMDGFHVCNRLKRHQDTTHIPVVMLTGADTADDTLHGLEVGADDYIPKDAFAVQNLLSTLEALLGKPSEQGENDD